MEVRREEETEDKKTEMGRRREREGAKKREQGRGRQVG